jgi:hypothetical protein
MTTTPTAEPQEGTMHQYLTPGTPLEGGVVVEMTFTSYKVEMPSGETTFVPFTKVHPLVAAEPLVVFA